MPQLDSISSQAQLLFARGQKHIRCDAIPFADTCEELGINGPSDAAGIHP
jgi:hypothetical protein